MGGKGSALYQFALHTRACTDALCGMQAPNAAMMLHGHDCSFDGRTMSRAAFLSKLRDRPGTEETT